MTDSTQVVLNSSSEEFNLFLLLGILLIFVGFLIKIIVSNIDVMELVNKRSISIFSSIQLIQIVTEMLMIAYLTPGNLIYNILRIFPWSGLEFIAASSFVMATAKYINKPGNMRDIILISCYFIGTVFMCGLMHAILMEAWGLYIMVDYERTLSLPTTWVFELALMRTELSYPQGFFTSILNVWSTLIIAFVAVGIELKKEIEKKEIEKKLREEEKIKKEQEDLKRKEEDLKKKKKEDRTSKSRQFIDVPGIGAILKEHYDEITLIFEGGPGQQSVKQIVRNKYGIKDRGNSYATLSRFVTATNKVIPWNEDIRWEELGSDCIKDIETLIVKIGNAPFSNFDKDFKIILVKALEKKYGLS